MKSLIPFTLALLIFCLLVSPATAAFTNMYVFGDTLSATTNILGKTPYSPGPPDYYGQRWSNGKVWVEVLAQMQGIQFQHSNNFSYYDHSSSNLVNEIGSAYLPNSLFVIWVCNADTFDAAQAGYNSSQWNTAIAQATNNHFKIITNLYSKGARTLILPNAVDISKVPDFNASAQTNTMRSGCITYNAALSNLIAQIRLNPAYTNLTIYTPDFFSLLNNILTNASSYGLTNPMPEGYTVAAVAWPAGTLSLSNGVNPNYVFWDPLCPSARLHYTMAGVANAMMSPPIIAGITPVNGSNRLDLASLPLATSKATNCFVLFATNLNQTVWQTNLPGFSSLNSTQQVFVPIVGGQRFYRIGTKLDFPWPWVWP